MLDLTLFSRLYYLHQCVIGEQSFNNFIFILCLTVDATVYESVLNYRRNRQTTADTICDVMDGQLYKDQFDDTWHFSGTLPEEQGQLHLSLQMNTDGVALFKSSTFGVWPVYMLINELEPKLRFVWNK